MKHTLYVGHFDTTVRTLRPKVATPMDLRQVIPLLMKHCDQDADGVAFVESAPEAECALSRHWVGRIGGEDIVFRDGFLECPWLGAGINSKSVRLIEALCRVFGVQVFEPGGKVFCTCEQLAGIEREFQAAFD